MRNKEQGEPETCLSAVVLAKEENKEAGARNFLSFENCIKTFSLKKIK